MQQRIALGHISGAHGIRGEVVIRSYTTVAEDIGAYGRVCDATGQRIYEFQTLRVTSKGIVARLKGISDRASAEALRGTVLHVDRSALPPAAAGEYYHADLVGLRAQSSDGSVIGTIIAVQNFGAGDLLEICRAGTAETDFVPFKDAYVPTVDIAAGFAVVIMPDLVGDPEPAGP